MTGMPACARAGTLGSAAVAASAPAKTSASARFAGVVRRALIGVPVSFIPVAVIAGKLETPPGAVNAGSVHVCVAQTGNKQREYGLNGARMLDVAKRLLTASARSDVPPFIVMDVMAAAARIEAAGGHVIHMEVGQPAAPAPSSAIKAAQAALAKGRIGY